MRKKLDCDNLELVAVLGQMVKGGVAIGVRSVARCHPSIHSATAFSRDTDRMALISSPQQLQRDAAGATDAVTVDLRGRLSADLSESQLKVLHLERVNLALIASHAACVRAVLKHGGIASLLAFWADYREGGVDLRALSVLPDAAVISMGVGGARPMV